MTTDLHRIYIQTLLARRVMSQNVALQLYGRAVEIRQSQLTFPSLPSY